jgi:hypothetical protein
MKHVVADSTLARRSRNGVSLTPAEKAIALGNEVVK